MALGQTAQAKQTAEVVLKSIERPTSAEELVWVLANRAEAQLLREDYAKAEQLYSKANPLADRRFRASMRRQVELLSAYAPTTSSMQAYWTPSKLDDVFGP